MHAKGKLIIICMTFVVLTCGFLLLLELLLELLFLNLHSLLSRLLCLLLLSLLLLDPLLQGGDVRQFLCLFTALCHPFQVEKHLHAVERGLPLSCLDRAWLGISSTRNTGKWTYMHDIVLVVESMYDNSVYIYMRMTVLLYLEVGPGLVVHG